MQLSDMNSKPHDEKSLIDLIDRAIGVRFYIPPGSDHYTLLFLERFHRPTHHQTPSNDKHRKIMRRYPRGVYNFLHTNCAENL